MTHQGAAFSSTILKVDNQQCQSYAEVAAENAAKEYDWINTDAHQQLSNDLDAAIKVGRSFGFHHWENVLRSHGREVACLELMYEKSIIDAKLFWDKGQRVAEEAEATCRDFEFKNWCYLHRERHWPVTTAAAFAHVQKTDAAFITKQKSTGFPTDDLERMIADLQKEESERLEWESSIRHRANLEKAERDKKTMEAEKRRAVIFAAAVRAEAESMITELVAAGVLHVGRK